MADTKELDFGQMMQSDPEYIDQERKRAIAQALAAATMKGQPTGGEFRRSPLAVLGDFMAMKNNKSTIQSINQSEAELYRKHKDVESAGVQELVNAKASGDTAGYRAALSKAIASQYPNLRRLGESLSKSDETNFGAVVQGFKERIKPQSAIEAGGDTRKLQLADPLGAPRIASGALPGGGQASWIEAPELNGTTSVHTLPVGASATVNMGDKPALDTEEQIGKHFAAGGKGYDEGQAAQRKLQSTQDLIRTLNENPALGSGGEALQGLRKFVETISPGSTQGLSANTEQAKMQLAELTISKLGGKLGSGISNADTQLVKDALGSLDTDPTALRRILVIGMKYQMRDLAVLAQGARDAEEMPSFAKRGVKLSNPYNFNIDTSVTGDPFMPPQMMAPAPGRPRPVGPSAPGLPPGVRPR